MPKSKTIESRNNIYKGIRKLSKKISKKLSKKVSKNNISTTEEMRNILNSDNNIHMENSKLQPQQMQPQQMQPQQMQQMQMMDQYQKNIDPYMVDFAVPTDTNGNMFNTNKIGALLGGIAQLNSNAHYVPQMNNMPQQMEQMMSQQMEQMMPQQMEQMMPQHMGQMMPQHMGQMMPQHTGQMMPQEMGQQIDNSTINNIKSLTNLAHIPKLI